MVSEPVCGPDTTVIEIPDTTNFVPELFTLYQNFPNPFNAETTIQYDLPEAVQVELVIYNVSGQKVRTLIKKIEMAGEKSIVWDGKDDRGFPLGSGTYLIRLRSGDFNDIKRMVLLR